MITHYTNRACNLTHWRSRPCVLGVWLVTYNHFHLHHIDSGFFLACGAKQRKFHQHSVLIYPRSCFSAANRAVNPSYFVHLFISTLSPAAWLCIEVSGSSPLVFRLHQDVRVLRSIYSGYMDALSICLASLSLRYRLTVPSFQDVCAHCFTRCSSPSSIS